MERSKERRAESFPPSLPLRQQSTRPLLRPLPVPPYLSAVLVVILRAHLYCLPFPFPSPSYVLSLPLLPLAIHLSRLSRLYSTPTPFQQTLRV